MNQVGSDESLKGDTFGGLVVAAVAANDDMRQILNRLGVTDSKKITDSRISVLAKQIKQFVPYSIISVLPEEYNKHSLTELLNTLHKKTAQEALGKAGFTGEHIVDKYPGCAVGDIAETKAESKFAEVAAASILARDEGLKQFNKLSKEAGFMLPKGSTHVAAALEKLKSSNLVANKFVKMHFKNVKLVFNL